MVTKILRGLLKNPLCFSGGLSSSPEITLLSNIFSSKLRIYKTKRSPKSSKSISGYIFTGSGRVERPTKWLKNILAPPQVYISHTKLFIFLKQGGGRGIRDLPITKILFFSRAVCISFDKHSIFIELLRNVSVLFYNECFIRRQLITFKNYT